MVDVLFCCGDWMLDWWFVMLCWCFNSVGIACFFGDNV